MTNHFIYSFCNGPSYFKGGLVMTFWMQVTRHAFLLLSDLNVIYKWIYLAYDCHDDPGFSRSIELFDHKNVIEPIIWEIDCYNDHEFRSSSGFSIRPFLFKLICLGNLVNFLSDSLQTLLFNMHFHTLTTYLNFYLKYGK